MYSLMIWMINRFRYNKIYSFQEKEIALITYVLQCIKYIYDLKNGLLVTKSRFLFLSGLVVMTKLVEEPVETEEILTICWEQSQHKYPERRLLAVECCSVLASYTSASVRNSLMLSMLQQMLLEDKDPVVRTSVVRSLALLIALMDDPDKYFQVNILSFFISFLSLSLLFL